MFFWGTTCPAFLLYTNLIFLCSHYGGSMKKHYLVHLIAVFLLITANEIYSQNTLYLVDTLTGPSTKNKLISARGIGDFNGDGYADFIVCYTNYTDLFFGNPDFTIKPIYRFNTGSAYGIGDVNGDDYADLLILRTDTLYNPAYPYAEIFFGGKELDTIPRFKYYHHTIGI